MSTINWPRVFLAVSFVVAVAVIFAVNTAYAGEYVPKESDQILVMRDGKVIGKMSRKDYKVVKIEKDAKVIKQRKVNKEYREKHNSVILHAGHGLNGNLNTGHNGSQHTVKQDRGAVGGVTLCHTKDTVGICASGFTNKSGYLGIKKDF